MSDAHVLIAARAASRKHAEDLLILDVRQICSVTDYFLIGTAGTLRQMGAIVEHIDESLREAGTSVWHVEGLEPRSGVGAGSPPAHADVAWVLMDCGDFVVHLFSPAARQLYQLERLWADAPRRQAD